MKILYFFLYLRVIFAFLDPDLKLMQIRIQIHNPVLSSKPLSIPDTWGLIIITTQIMHGKQGQYSRVPMLPHLCEILKSGTHGGMDYSYT